MLESLESRQLLAANAFDLQADLPHADALAAASDPVVPTAASSAIPEALRLHSNPNSTFKIFLDFDGHITEGTRWNEGLEEPILVEEPANISPEMIRRIWQGSAEDFAPFDVDVTTEDPGTEALRKDGEDDTEYGVRVIVTPQDTHQVCLRLLDLTCGGVAGLGTFDSSVDTPVYTFTTSLAAVGTNSHEVGHAFGLGHDGANVSGTTVEYYPGHDSGFGETWFPIMGGGAGLISTWSDGSYFNANNQQDDLAVITTENGIGYRQDDHSNDFEFATPLRVTDTNQVSFSGIIERNDDVDVFSYQHGGGPVNFDIHPFLDDPNLDIWAGIYDEEGDLVVQSVPLLGTTPVANPGLSVSFDIPSLPAGEYFLKVDGVGSHATYDPLRDLVYDPSVASGVFNADPEFVDPWTEDPPVGYSNYASLGQYWIEGAIVPPSTHTINIVASDAVKPEGNTNDETNFVFTLTRTGPIDAATNVDYIVVPALPTEQGGNYEHTPMGDDFRSIGFPLELPSGFATFEAGQETTEISITVGGDTDFEPDEYFEVLLFEPIGETVPWTFENSSAIGIIESDEAQFYVQSPISTISAQLEGDDLGGSFLGAAFEFTVVRASDGRFDDAAISVPWTVDSSAFVDSQSTGAATPSDFVDQNGDPITNLAGDRVFPSGSALFAPGQLEQVVTVYARADRIAELDESFHLVLEEPSYAQFPNPGWPLSIDPALDRARAVILNEDIVAAPTLSVEAAIAGIYEKGDQVVVQQEGDFAIATRVTVTRDGDILNNPVVVTIALDEETDDEAFLMIGPPSEIDSLRDGPKSIDIPFDADQVVFDNLYLVSVEDGEMDGRQTVTLNGTAEDHIEGQATAFVYDTDGTALDRYIAKVDDSYEYTLVDTIPSLGSTTYIIDMTSQTWRDISEVDRPVWKHWVQIIVPNNAVSDTAVLVIGGDNNSENAPTEPDTQALLFAQQTNQVTILLPTVPNQPLVFTDDPDNPRTEDAIIAYSYDKYLDGGDEEWPVLLPMVKSAVAAMDTAQDFLDQQIVLDIEDFFVTGGSKRGWTTWLTAAVDDRVSGIAPAVIDVLNMEVSLKNHKENYEGVTIGVTGGFSNAIRDYTELDVFDRFSTPAGRELARIVDPFAYRSRITMPKYLLNSAGDPFFTPDSSQFYINELEGPTYLRYFPNTGHSLTDINGEDQGAPEAVATFNALVDAGVPLPRFDWTVEGDGDNVIRLNTVDTPVAVNLWQATNPTSLDFRIQTFGPQYTSTPLSDQGGGEYIGSVPLPVTGGTAFFVEMTYLVNGAPITFTTELRIAEPPPPSLIAVTPGVSPDTAPDLSLSELNVLEFAPQDLTFQFNSQQRLAPELSGIQFFASGGDDLFGQSNDLPVIPDSIEIQPDGYTVVATFAQPLPEERYRIVITGEDDFQTSVVGLRNSNGDIFESSDGQNTELIDFDVSVIFDYGDAPASYGTLLVDDGARHVIEPWQSLRLGPEVDTEPDGQPTDADDLTGVDDEDGVSIGTFFDGTTSRTVFTLPGTDPNNVAPEQVLGVLNSQDPAGADVSVHVFGEGFLDVWVDFDQNGTFDVDEKVVNGLAVTGDPVSGSFQTVNLQTPSDAVSGLTWMRVRVAESPTSTPDGVATGGEVEDYQVEVFQFADGLPGDNQAPSFDFDVPPSAGLPTLHLLERDDSLETVVENFAINISPGDPDSLDEIATQNIATASIAELAVPTGLMTAPPALTVDGQLTVFPAPDAVGSATYEVTLTDDHPTNPRSTTKTFVIQLQPVNDAPRLNASVIDTSATDAADSEYSHSVAVDGTITYTLREDNLQPGGLAEPFFIPLTADTTGAYNRIGLLDVFTVGPENESDGTIGGSQSLSLTSTSGIGGTLTEVAGGWNYMPPADFNFDSDGVDSFQYIVSDDGVTYDPGTGSLEADPQTRINRVEFVLAAVNDAPVFTLSADSWVTSEDGPAESVANFATEIGGGPIDTADDENVAEALASLAFELTPVNFDPADISLIFSSPPAIDPSNGRLTFETAANVFGSFQFEVRLSDDGPSDPNRGDSNRSAPQLLTIDVVPQNDPPEIDPAAPALSFALDEDTTAELEISELLSDIDPGPTTPYGDESADVTPGGNQTVTLADPIPTATDAGGTLQFLTTNGPPRLIYTPPLNFNGVDTFTYSLTDDGVSVGLDQIPSEDPQTITRTVTLNVNAVNNPPVFEINAPLDNAIPTLNLLERDTPEAVVVSQFASNIGPGPITAADESATQQVSFSILQTSGPVGLMAQMPQLNPTGQLMVYPSADAVGMATYSVTLTDDHPTDPRSTTKTFAINIRPVNDAPQPNSNVAPSSESDPADADQSYAVAEDGTITYTLREDNTQSGGATEPFFIPLRSSSTAGYDRIGLLDVFDVGPENESGASDGGSQSLMLLTPTEATTTLRGGTLTPVEGGWNYVPPVDFNFSSGGADSFTYQVGDDGTSFDLDSGEMEADPKTRVNRVDLILNDVNDAPVFNMATDRIVIQEDNSLVSIANFATGVGAGPIPTATDEIGPTSSQSLAFSIAPIDFNVSETTSFFTRQPSIDPQTGRLTFETSANVFGSYQFEVHLHDGGADDPSRGDRNQSAAQLLTIDVLAQNDPPEVDPGTGPLEFELSEDGSIEIEASQLTNVFAPGPLTTFGDESIGATVGGNQTVSLMVPIPTTTSAGGTLQLISDDGPVRWLYTPPENFNGLDTFVYTVSDDGQSIGLDEDPVDDRQTANHTVRLNVAAVNDAPEFDPIALVESDEDAGLVVVDDWATDVSAGPTTADDEVSGPAAQQLSFRFTQTAGDPDLIVPGSITAIVDPQTGVATLVYQTEPDANGQATFDVVLEDNGPDDESNGDEFVSDTYTLQIVVAPVNDPPSFTLTTDEPIVLAEDGGPQSIPLLSDILSGPDNEGSQDVSFEVQPLAAEFASLFSELPTIDTAGSLHFTTAPDQNTDNANGPVPVHFLGRDSNGATTSLFEVQIDISEVNDPPIARADSFDTDEDQVLTLDVSQLLANDTDPDLQTNTDEVVQIQLAAQQQTASGALLTYSQQNGKITYDPTGIDSIQQLLTGEALFESFTYSLIDAAGETSDIVTVILQVAGLNDVPTTEADIALLQPEGSTVVRVLDNDRDTDGAIDPTTVEVTSEPTLGVYVITTAGVILYTPFVHFAGDDTFTYTVADNLGGRSAPSVVTVSANPSLYALDDRSGTHQGESIQIDVAANDLQSENLDLSSIVVVDQPQSGEAIPQSDGTVLYVPDPEFVGTDSFTYRISDQQGGISNTATVDTQVVASRLQNPTLFGDVNADGQVTAIDALLIINHLRNNGGQNEIPVLETDQGPNYFDVSGNQSISAIDALRVVNMLSVQNAGSEAEQSQPRFVVPAVMASEPAKEQASSSAFDSAITDLSRSDKIVDAVVPLPESRNWVDTIGIPQPADNDEEDDFSAMVDRALAELG